MESHLAKMDSRFLALGKAITACAVRASCPGVRNQMVRNDVTGGTPPRGLFIRPSHLRAEDVKLVLLGQNPGRASGFERALNRTFAESDRERLFERIHESWFDGLSDIEYALKLDRLATELLSQETTNGVILAEVAFCESLPGVNFPGRDTLAFCSSQFLDRLAHELPAGTPWVCIGAPARDWMQGPGNEGRFRWAWVEHVTGSWGTYRSMFDESRRLRRDVRAQWEDVMSGKTVGVCLTRLRP